MAEECRPDPTEQHLGLEDEQEPERAHYNGAQRGAYLARLLYAVCVRHLVTRLMTR